MKITLEVPDNKMLFIMELIESIPFIKIEKAEDLKKDMDTTDYLLQSPNNSERLMDAINRSKHGEIEYHNLLEE